MIGEFCFALFHPQLLRVTVVATKRPSDSVVVNELRSGVLVC
jgi:hypothetical protein